MDKQREMVWWAQTVWIYTHDEREKFISIPEIKRTSGEYSRSDGISHTGHKFL